MQIKTVSNVQQQNNLDHLGSNVMKINKTNQYSYIVTLQAFFLRFTVLGNTRKMTHDNTHARTTLTPSNNFSLILAKPLHWG